MKQRAILRQYRSGVNVFKLIRRDSQTTNGSTRKRTRCSSVRTVCDSSGDFLVSLPVEGNVTRLQAQVLPVRDRCVREVQSDSEEGPYKSPQSLAYAVTCGEESGDCLRPRSVSAKAHGAHVAKSALGTLSFDQQLVAECDASKAREFTHARNACSSDAAPSWASRRVQAMKWGDPGSVRGSIAPTTGVTFSGFCGHARPSLARRLELLLDSNDHESKAIYTPSGNRTRYRPIAARESK